MHHHRRLAALTAFAVALTCGAAAPAPARAGEGDDRVHVLRDVRNVRDVRVVVPQEGRTVVLGGGRRGYLGVHVVDLTPELRRHFGVGEGAGVLVYRVEDDSPAATAGVAVGDVLVAVDGDDVASAWDLRRLVGPHDGGDSVPIEVVRAGRSLTLAATLEERQGRVVDVGRLLQRNLEGRPLVVVPDGEAWEDLAESFGELGEEIGAAFEDALENPDVRFRIQDELRHRGELERQIQVLERKLRELERRLESERR
jgi:hypothetical protein